MTGFSLKEHLFNRQKVEYLAGLFSKQDPNFAHKSFVANVTRKFPSLELKQRIIWIAESLEKHLPTHFPDAAKHILRCLPPPLDPNKTDDDFGDFIFAPLGELVVRNGASHEYLDLSLATLKEITTRFSMEDAVRAFIRKFPDETMQTLTGWVYDSNYHVRRLVSESTRPLLPWSGRIDLPPERTIALLNQLHADRTRYVTRSVANHLNDIAKNHPELVIQSLSDWHRQEKQHREELMWMTRHSLRTLVKRGHVGALRLLGFNPKPKLEIGAIELEKSKLLPGELLEFALDITALRSESLVIDYAIEYAKAGGKRSTKVYKASKLSIKKGETVTIRKSHRLHAQATTYRLYPGKHLLTIQINGQSVGTVPFTIL